MKRYHVETTPDSDYDLSRHFDYIYTNLQNEQAVFHSSMIMMKQLKRWLIMLQQSRKVTMLY